MIQQSNNNDDLYFLRQPEITDVGQTLSIGSFLNQDMIHVGFSSSNLYAKLVGTAMFSMFENTKSKVTVHILHDNTLTQDNRDKFIQIAERYRQRVEFHNVEESCADKIAEIRKAFPGVDKTRFTIATLFRILFPFVLPSRIEKAIFLDGDIIVNLDIKELWQYELDDNVLGGISHKELGYTPEIQKIVIDGYVKAEDHFNAGVLLMNLKLLRKEEETLINGIRFVLGNPNYNSYLDQTVLQYCFSTRTIKLPIKFNLITYRRRLHETDIGRNIYHYVSPPVYRDFLNQKNDENRLYMSYFMKTPWFDEGAIGRLYEGFLKVRNDLQTRTARLSAIMSGKTRAFFVEPSKIDSMKKFFSIRNNEMIISAENEESITKLIDVMKASKDKCVFFIMTPRFLNKSFPFDLLIKEGFVLDKDFVRGWEFLSEAYGNPFYSWSLFQAM